MKTKLYPFIFGILSAIFIYLSFCLIQENIYRKEYHKYKNQYSWLTKDIFKIVKTEATRHDIDKNIIFAIIHSESRGNQYAVSSAGALGLMQVMPFHVSERKEALFDLEKNIKTGTRILSDNLKKYNGNLIKSLNAYERGNKRQDINVAYLSEIIQNIFYK